MMDIQKEREAYLKMLVGNDAISNDQAETLKLMSEGSHFYTYGNQVSAAKLDLINWGWNSWVKAKSQAVPEGFVLVPNDQFESLSMFKDLYKRAIISARKRKDQLNWAHVAGLGVGSGRAVELCKMLNIDPSATNMHKVIQEQEQSHDQD